MAEPIKHGQHWWTRAADGSWLRWDAAERRWDPQTGPPPPGVEEAERAAATERAGVPAATVPAREPEPAATHGRRAGGVWDAPPSGATAVPADETAISRRLRDYESIEGKARAAVVILAVTSLVSLIIGPWALQRAASGTIFELESPALAGLSTFALFAFIASAIALIIWFKGAYDNASPLGATDLRFSPGWAIGGWFIPIANLFIPKKIADDIWRVSDPALPADAGARWRFQPVPAIIHIWWALWVVQVLMGRAADGMLSRAITNGDPSGYKTAVGLQGVAALLLTLAGLLLIRIIIRITARQKERAELLRSKVHGLVPSA